MKKLNELLARKLHATTAMQNIGEETAKLPIAKKLKDFFGETIAETKSLVAKVSEKASIEAQRHITELVAALEPQAGGSPGGASFDDQAPKAKAWKPYETHAVTRVAAEGKVATSLRGDVTKIEQAI